MKNKNLLVAIGWLIFTIMLNGCVSSPTGRSQVLMYSEQQMAELGQASFSEMKKKMPVEQNSKINRYVQCVAQAVEQQVPAAYGIQNWELVVFKSKEVNAFALPGGKVGVYTGLLKVANNPDQLATVIGHEISHVLARHSNERISRQALAGVGMGIADAAMGQTVYREAALNALGAGVQLGVLLPFDRAQENEADIMGLELMAKAGFDPEASVQLWQKMAAQGEGKAPPELLSTHPTDQKRIATLSALLPRMRTLMENAHLAGLRPACAVPAQ